MLFRSSLTGNVHVTIVIPSDGGMKEKCRGRGRDKVGMQRETHRERGGARETRGEEKDRRGLRSVRNRRK